MNSVLVMQLAGPLQSWGASSRFARRGTEHAPTKSGVLGLLAAAQGRARTDALDDLGMLRFGVRVDQPGSPLRDFHTAHRFTTGEALPVSERIYLADAVFVAAVEGDADLIDTLHQAVRQPVFMPYLGRRSCPPARPVELGVIHGQSLSVTLKDHPWEAARWYKRRRCHQTVIELEMLLEATDSDGPVDTLPDQPLSFDPIHRRYALRGVHRTWVTVRNPAARINAGAIPDHDPTSVLDDV